MPSIGYGFSLGGPVYLPKVYDGRKKTFFQVTLQRYPSDIPQDTEAALPTNAMQGIGTPNGGYDLSALGTTIIDPTTGQPFSGNIIPAARVSQVAKNALSIYYPQIGNVPFGDADYEPVSSYLNPYWDIFARVDHQLGSKDAVSGSYVRNHETLTYNPSGANGFASGPTGFSVTTTGLQYYLFGVYFINVSENHIFSQRLLNEANFGVKHGPVTSAIDNQIGATVLAGLGLPATPGAPTGITGGPAININDVSGLFWGTQGQNTGKITTFRDVLSFVSGRYTTKGGAEVIRQNSSSTSYDNLFGTYNFTGNFTGSSYGDFLLGLPTSDSRNLPPGTLGQSSQQLGFFVTENVHASKKVTVDLGVRIELLSPIIDPGGRYYNFDPATGQLVVPGASSLTLLNPGLSPALLATVLPASAVGYPTQLVNRLVNITPRLGIAYHVRDNTVLRAAYGTYGTLQNLGGPTGGIYTAGSQSNTNPSCAELYASGLPCTPDFTLANPFPPGGVVGVSRIDVTGINPNLKAPVTHEWNATVEQRLPADIVFRVSYVGSLSLQLPYKRNVDLPQASTTPFTAARLLYPGLDSAIYADSGGNATYNGLDIEFKRRFSKGFLLNGGYIWAKCLTDDDEGGQESNFGSWGAAGITSEDPYNRSRDQGNCEETPRHMFRAFYTWDLPVGQGRTYLAHPKDDEQKILNGVFGGWTWSGSFNARTGGWYTPYWSGYDAANTGQTLIRPDRVCNGNNVRQTNTYLFDPSCFTLPASGTYGNAGMNILQGLGSWNYDAGIFKNINFSSNERWPTLRLAMNAQNILNHTLWVQSGVGAYTVNNPPGVVAVAVGGLASSGINASLGSMRIIYLEARIEF
jgi:hypothetical protein